MPQESSDGTARKAVPGKEEKMRKGSTEDSGRGPSLSSSCRDAGWDGLWIKTNKAVYRVDERTVNSISGLLATHPGTAKHIILVLMPHVPTSTEGLCASWPSTSFVQQASKLRGLRQQRL